MASTVRAANEQHGTTGPRPAAPTAEAQAGLDFEFLNAFERPAMLFDLAGRCAFANAAAAELVGQHAEWFLGRPCDQLLPPQDRDSFHAACTKVLSGTSRAEVVVLRDDQWLSSAGTMGRVQRVGDHMLLVIQRTTSEARRARAAQSLGSTLDWDATLQSIAQAALGEFADWCALDLLGPDGMIRRVVATNDDNLQSAALRLAELGILEGSFIRRAVRTGRPKVARDAQATTDLALMVSDEQRTLVESMGFATYIVVPGRDPSSGLVALTLVRGKGPGYSDDDLLAAQELAARAESAIANARAFTRERAHGEALARSEARFRALISATSNVVWTRDAEGHSLEPSPTWEAFTGQPFHEYEHSGWLAAVHPDDRADVAARWSKQVRERTSAEIQFRLRRTDGTYAWVAQRSAPVLDDRGEVREWVGIATDVTERRRVAAALEESETRLRMTLSAAQIGTWDFDPRNGNVFWSDREKSLYGLPPDAEIDATTFFRALHPRDRERATQRVAEAMDPVSGGHYRDEFRVVGLEGVGHPVDRWVVAQGRCMFDERGRPVRLIGADIDVTESRAASQRLALLAEVSRLLSPGQRSIRGALGEVAHRLAVELSDVCLVALAEGEDQGVRLVAAEAQTTQLGAALPVAKGAYVPRDRGHFGTAFTKRKSVLVPVVDPAARDDLIVTPQLTEAFADIPIASVMMTPVLVAHRAVGALVCVRTSGRPFVAADLVLLQDLADRCALAIAESQSRERAEAALQQIESIMGAVPMLISFVDAAGRYRYVSGGYAAWFSEPRERYVGRTVREVVGEQAYERIRPMVESALRGERQEFELELPYVAGGARQVHATYLPQFGPSGEPAGFVAVVVDVTAQKALVESLRSTVRFSEEFVGVVGHDLRSPLAAIVSAAEFFERQSADERTRAVAVRIRSSAMRMVRLIEQILDFTRARLGTGIPITPTTTDLGRLAQQIVDELRASCHRPIELEIEGDTTGAWDPDRICQVIANLASNAVAHGKEGNPVKVRARSVSVEEVELAVWNAGAIAAGQVHEIFSPFRRGPGAERTSRGGLGLGLYIVQQIVLGHGGSIAVQSAEHEGTTFVVRLPRKARVAGPRG